MHWRLILALGGGLGVLMGMAAVQGWLANPSVEFGFWTVMGIFAALAIARDTAKIQPSPGPPAPVEPRVAPDAAEQLPATTPARKPFTVGLLTGVVMGVVQHAVVFALWPQFLERNPHFVEQAAQFPNLQPRVQLLIGLVPRSVFWGVVLGLLAWIVARWGLGRPAGQPVDQEHGAGGGE